MGSARVWSCAVSKALDHAATKSVGFQHSGSLYRSMIRIIAKTSQGLGFTA